MKIDPIEYRDGMRWFFAAGFFALALSVFLYRVDIALTNSDREDRLEKTLYELRLAQSSLSAGPVDERQIVSVGDHFGGPSEAPVELDHSDGAMHEDSHASSSHAEVSVSDTH